MANLFFYGTLRDPALRAIVLGREAETVAACLPGHVVCGVDAGHFVGVWPLIRVGEGAACGVLLRDATDADLARLDFYEGGFGYALRPVEVQIGVGIGAGLGCGSGVGSGPDSRPDSGPDSGPSSGPDSGPDTVQALVYFPDTSATGDAVWSLDHWQAQWGAVSRSAAVEAMERFGTVGQAGGQAGGQADIATLLPMFRSRAWAQQIARHAAPQTVRTDMTVADVEVQSLDRGYDGFFRLRPFSLRYRRFDGAWGDVLRRECFVSYDVALVLPYDPVRDAVLLVEQLRFGPILRGDPAPWVLEPVAGMIDAGETPEQAARREAVEEAGLDMSRLIALSRGYASPGYSTEFYHNFVGLCDLGGRSAPGIAGLDAEHEDIRSHVLPFEHAMRLIDSGEINAAPLQMLLFGLALRRAELRAEV